MKARMPVNAKTKKLILAEVEAEMKRQRRDMTRRFFKLPCIALHELYGFGYLRLGTVVERITELADEHDQDEVFWAHVDRVLIHELKLGFDEEREE